MDRFIARENIKHFCELLFSDIDAGERLRVQALLVEELDKLAKDVELLAEIERRIAEGDRRIAEQRSSVAAMQRDGHHGLGRARALLDGMTESQRLTTDYHQRVANEMRRDRLLDR